MDIYLYSKQNRSCVVKRNIDTIENAPFCPGMTRQIHSFLGCSRAFDRHGRLAEQGHPFSKLPDKAPGVRGRFEAAVERSPITAHASGQPREGDPVQTVPGATHT